MTTVKDTLGRSTVIAAGLWLHDGPYERYDHLMFCFEVMMKPARS